MFPVFSSIFVGHPFNRTLRSARFEVSSIGHSILGHIVTRAAQNCSEEMETFLPKPLSSFRIFFNLECQLLRPFHCLATNLNFVQNGTLVHEFDQTSS